MVISIIRRKKLSVKVQDKPRTHTQYHLGGCRVCGGDQYYETDLPGYKCLQCGRPEYDVYNVCPGAWRCGITGCAHIHKHPVMAGCENWCFGIQGCTKVRESR